MSSRARRRHYADDYNKLKGMVGSALAAAAVLALVGSSAGLVSLLSEAGSTDSERSRSRGACSP
jgi:hypothetical protein